jgi:tetraacyldisaccharide 4'-kinase
MRLIERIWNGDSPGGVVARAALVPLEVLFRAAVAIRSELYDRGIAHVEPSAIPVISVGNLTVGGTGKTPVTAWLAGKLEAHGISPAIVLRGYGGDEPLVHQRLNPQTPVIVAPDRSQGVQQAVTIGAGVAILDDAFQHRRASRDLDLVLLSADDWTANLHLLPAGPYREPMTALSRSSAVIITRKAASDQDVQSAAATAKRYAPGKPVAVVRLELGDLVCESMTAPSLPVTALASRNILAVAAIGNSEAFFRQLESVEANVTQCAFPDHHSFTARDLAAIRAKSAGSDYVISTLKDAVKLGPVWPAEWPPLWYVSLAVKVESGEAAIDQLLMRLKGRIDVN